MYSLEDEVISKKLFAETKEQDVKINIYVDFLLKFNGKTIRTLSGKNVHIRVSYADHLCILNTPTFQILVADAEFEKFCSCFPYNESITYDDILQLVNVDTKFKNGVMPPRSLLSYNIDQKTFDELDLFYSMVLNK